MLAMLKNILVTGGSGFLGEYLLPALMNVSRLLVVTRRAAISGDSNHIIVTDIGPENNWSEAISGIDVVIHAAARAHIMKDISNDPLAEYRKVNVDGTLNLARQAAAAGVKRFIFISSVKVNGEATSHSTSFTERDTPSPVDAYGISKMEAETGLRSIAAETCMEVVIIRPPLVYGPGVKANFLNLLKLASTSMPLPFGAIHNSRSMIYVGNLVDFIIKCIDHPAAANQTFLVSDGDDLSLTSLLKEMRVAFGRPPRLIPVPTFLFKFAGALTGKRDVINRLIGDLQIDSAKAQNLIGWQPPFSVTEGINETIKAYKIKVK